MSPAQLGNNTLVVDANSMSVLSSMITSTQVNIPGATPVPIGYDTTIEQVSVIHALDALTSTGAFIPNGVEGVPLNNVLVGTFNFTDPVPPSVFGNPADFTATINWGDGSATSAGTIVQTSPAASGQVPFQVLGTHTYAEENAPGTLYQISVTITDKGSTRSFTPDGRGPGPDRRQSRRQHDHARTRRGRGRAGDGHRRPDHRPGRPDRGGRGPAAACHHHPRDVHWIPIHSARPPTTPRRSTGATVPPPFPP